MSDDPESIVRQIRQADEHFQELMAYLRGPEAQASSAYEVELRLFRSLLALGAKLLALFFTVRAAAPRAEPVTAPDGRVLQPHSWRQTTYLSVFGPIRFRRRYYWAGGAGCCPLDAELSLPRRCYSDLLRSWLEFAVTNDAYDQAVGLLERVLGVAVSKRALERLAAEDARDVNAFYEGKVPPQAAEEGAILVVQADGKGVRLRCEADDPRGRRTQKKEAVITAIYSIEPHLADAEAIADMLAGNAVDQERVAPKVRRPEPVGKQLRATLDGKEVAFKRLLSAVRQRDGPHKHRVALTDGEALQERMLEHLPQFTLVLDVVHAVGYVHDAAVALLGEDYPYLRDFVACRLHEILTGRLERAIAIIDWLAGMKPLSEIRRAEIATALRYLRNNAEYMHYDRYLALGWPIATGIAEGACGHLVKDRMERAGMHWRKPGAEAILQLRAVRVNDDWDAYQSLRRQQAHARLYGGEPELAAPPEEEALALAA